KQIRLVLTRRRIALSDAHVCKETKYRQQETDTGSDGEKRMDAGPVSDQADRYSRSANHGEKHLNPPLAQDLVLGKSVHVILKGRLDQRPLVLIGCDVLAGSTSVHLFILHNRDNFPASRLSGDATG